MNGTVSVLGNDFPVQFQECRLSVSRARLITGTPTTGKTTLCGVLRSVGLPTLESDEYIRTFAPEWNRDRLWMPWGRAGELYEARMRSGFAITAARCLVQPSGCVVTNWMGDDLFPYLQEAAYGVNPFMKDADVVLESAGLQYRRVDTGGSNLTRLPVVFVRSSSSDVRRLSAGRMGQGTWVNGLPEALVQKWSLLWSPQDLSGRYARVVYLGLPTEHQTHLWYEFGKSQSDVVLASSRGGLMYLCRLTRILENSRGEPTTVDFFFSAVGENGRLVAVDSVEDDLFICDVIQAIYGYSNDSGFSYDPVTIAWAKEAARIEALKTS